MEIRNLTCISCPMGCPITVEMEGEEIISVTGNTCKRGEVYARKEVTNPYRNLHCKSAGRGSRHGVRKD